MYITPETDTTGRKKPKTSRQTTPPSSADTAVSNGDQSFAQRLLALGIERVDIQDALPQYQAAIVDVMERVFDQYPILCGTVSYVVMDEYTSVALARLQWEQAQSLIRMGLHLNYPLFRDPNLEQRTAHGPLQRIIAHECAHLIEFALAIKQSGVVAGQQTRYEKLLRCMRRLNERSFVRNLRAAALMASRTSANDIPALVSAYATKNEAEFMAEAFAEGMTREETNVLVKEVCAQIQRWAVKYA